MKFSKYLEEFVLTLNQRDREIFQKRIAAETPKTLQDIGDEYGISRERARQIEAKIIKNLKAFVKKKVSLRFLSSPIPSREVSFFLLILFF